MSIANEIERIQHAKEDIKAAIEKKGVEVGEGTIDTYAEKIGKIVGYDYEQGYEDGKNSVADYLPFANTVKFSSFNDFGKAEVELNLHNVIDFYQLCRVSAEQNRNTTVEHLTINGSNPTSMISMLECTYEYRDLTLKRLTLNFDTSNTYSFQNAFACLQGLEIIDGKPLDFSGVDTTKTYAINNIINYCNALKEIRVVENTIPMNLRITDCKNLSDESIQSIIDGLKDMTGGTALTLTFHKDVGAKLTDAQKATITAKNWTLVY